MFKKIVGLGFSHTGKNAKDAREYIKSLVVGGANEFFTGYNPPYWYEKFGFEVSPNMRFAEHEQITDFETLKTIAEEVHTHDLEIFGNLNFRYYTDETFPLIEKIIKDFQEVGLDGIITSSISVLEYLKKIDYKGKINISTIFALYNKEAIRFFLENYKINKIILSREITLKEIENLVNEFPDTKFEVFGEGDFCRYNNGLCFAEHKYSSKDICTIVVNDLVVKKKFRPDFKKFVLDESLSNEEKVNLMNGEYYDIFEEMENLMTLNETGLCHSVLDTESLSTIKQKDGYIIKNAETSSAGHNYIRELEKLVDLAKNRVDLYFDAMKPYLENKKILSTLKALKYLNEKGYFKDSETSSEGHKSYKDLQKELENSIKTGFDFYVERTKEIGGTAKLKAEELKKFYGRSDNLNLYSYLFFSKFPNIETVKFPTRGRNYNEKLATIQDVVNSGTIDEKYLDRGISLERTHYDLTYLFGEKLWFRKLLNNLH